MKIRFKKNGLFISILVSVLIASIVNFPAFAAEKGNGSLDWANFNLSKEQIKSIQALDTRWKQINDSVRPQILKDQQMLKRLLKNPNVADSQLRDIQKRIITNQDKLKFAALEMFLDKRALLTSTQRKKLHKVISE